MSEDQLKFYDYTEVAKILRVHRSTISRLIDAGKLGVTEVGTRRLVSHAHLEQYIEANTRAAQPGANDPQPRRRPVPPPERQKLREAYPFLQRDRSAS